MNVIRDKLLQFAIMCAVSTIFSLFFVITVIFPLDSVIAQPNELFTPAGRSNDFALSRACINETMPSWTGVTARDITEEIANVLGLNHSVGALVTDVTPNSIAQRAGILGGDKIEDINGKHMKLGDVVLEVDNKTVKDKHDLDIKLRKQKIGNSLKIKLFRDGKQQTINISSPAMPNLRYENHTIYRNPSSIDFLPYESIRLGIEIQHPSDWEIDEKNIMGSKYGRILFRSNFENTSDFNVECLELSVVRISSETTDQEFYQRLLRSINNNYKDAIIIGPNVAKLAHNPSGNITFHYTDSIQGKIKAMKIATIKNDTAYVISYFAEQSKFDDYFPTIQKMIDSFNILQISSYEDFALGIKLKYPSNWKPIEDKVLKSNIYSPLDTSEKHEISFVHPLDNTSDNRFGGGLRIIVDSPREGESLNAVVNRRIEELEDDLNNFNLNGNSTLPKFENIIPSQGLNYSFGHYKYGIIKTNEIITIQNNKLYYISYSEEKENFSEHLQIINDIIDSIRIFGTITYGNIDLGITLQYPSGWIKDENISSGYVAFDSPRFNYDDSGGWDFSEKTIIVSVDTDHVKSAKQIVDEKLHDAKHSLHDFNLVENETTFQVKASNDSVVEGLKIVFNYSEKETSRPVKYKTMQIYTNTTDKLYNITYTSELGKYDTLLTTIDEIIDSLKIILPNSEVLQGSFPNGSQIINHPFKINYPIGWNTQEFNSGVTLSPPSNNSLYDIFPEFVQIRYSPAERARLSELMNIDFAYYRNSFKELVTVASKLPYISGFSGTSVEFTYMNNQGIMIRDRLLYLTHRNLDIYTITYSAELNEYYKYLPVVEEMIRSLEVERSIEQKRPNGFSVDKRPVGIAINSDTNMLYVTNVDDNTVSVIDGDTNKIVESIRVGIEPHDLAINQETNTIYVTNLGSDEVTVIHGSNNTVIKRIPVYDSPIDIAINQQKNMIYVADPSSNTITVINGSKYEKVDDHISLGPFNPSYDYKDGIGIALNEFTNTVYVTSESEIKVIDGNTMTILNNITDFRMRTLIDIAVDPIIGKVYAADLQGEVFVIDMQTNEVNQIPTELNPNNIAVNPNTNLVYISNQLSDSVSVIDPSNNYSPNRPIRVDKEPFGMAVNPETNIIYATNYASKTISVIDGNTSQIHYGITLNINPSNSGQIECNGKQSIVNTMILISPDSHCGARANDGYAFSSWSKSSDSNSNMTIATKSEPERLLSFISNIFPSSNERTLTINEHGNFTANFIKTEQMEIPREIWISLFGISISFIIPSILRWYNGWRQRKNLRMYIEELPSKYNQLDRKKIDVEITELYTKGKINESQQKILKDKVSDYYNDAHN